MSEKNVNDADMINWSILASFSALVGLSIAVAASFLAVSYGTLSPLPPTAHEEVLYVTEDITQDQGGIDASQDVLPK